MARLKEELDQVGITRAIRRITRLPAHGDGADYGPHARYKYPARCRSGLQSDYNLIALAPWCRTCAKNGMRCCNKPSIFSQSFPEYDESKCLKTNEIAVQINGKLKHG